MSAPSTPIGAQLSFRGQSKMESRAIAQDTSAVFDRLARTPTRNCSAVDGRGRNERGAATSEARFQPDLSGSFAAAKRDEMVLLDLDIHSQATVDEIRCSRVL